MWPLCFRARLQKLRAKVPLVLVWGCGAWHLQADELSTVTSAIVHITRATMRAMFLAGENWLDWHRCTWRAASDQLAASWGIDSATAMVACAVVFFSGSAGVVWSPQAAHVVLAVLRPGRRTRARRIPSGDGRGRGPARIRQRERQDA